MVFCVTEVMVTTEDHVSCSCRWLCICINGNGNMRMDTEVMEFE